MKSNDRSKLGDYRRKRDASVTNEPFGDDAPASSSREGTTAGAYVVHLHDATRRHYDLRLEIGGVLASFAVPHGLALDPERKHLAVKTEDHPIEYLEFEDVIPEKQYGAGPMIAWDRGSVTYLEGPAEDEVAQGKLHVELRGLKLRGRFALVRLAKGETGNEWLLFKKQDEHASKDRVITEELPRSIYSGLTVDELEGAAAIGAAHVARAFELGAKRLGAAAARELSARDRSPLVVAASGETPRGEGWVYDAQLEGLRVVASRDGDVVSIALWGANGSAETVEAFYPEVVRALRALPLTRIVIDGELCAFDASGHPSLSRLAQRALQIAKGDAHRATTFTPVTLVAQDLLVVGDADVRSLPLSQRRELLASIMPDVGFLRAAPPLEGPTASILELCAAHGIPGVVAKKKSAPYEPKKAGWLSLSSGVAPRSRAIVDHRAADPSRAVRQVTITNRGKIFWPDEGYTKGDLCDYYANVADVVLPYLVSRPVILVRYPDGIAGKSFFQWNVPPGMPAWVRTLSIPGDEGEKKRGFLIDDAPTLLYVANLACIPLHILAARMPDLAQADFFTVDFDVKQSELRHAVTLATTLRKLLEAIGLEGLPKTSGQSGLHVLVPLGRGQSFETARALADLLGKLLVEQHPDIATMDRVVTRRGARVYVDTGQTGRSRAIVAPYSVRAVAGAQVSTPLDWDEITPDLDPRAFTIKTLPARLAKHGDPMSGLLEAKPDVARAVTALSGVVGSRAR
ncbi:MAG: hypothetical protein KF819_05215 [Labilithrix sp.]|nr:hypothetical protein [Labilithrix sp.]